MHYGLLLLSFSILVIAYEWDVYVRNVFFFQNLLMKRMKMKLNLRFILEYDTVLTTVFKTLHNAFTIVIEYQMKWQEKGNIISLLV